MIEKHLMKLRARDEISAEEEAAIRSAVSETRDYPADRTIIRRGEDLDHSTLLLEGILCRYKDLRDGQRQITELHVAGDFADLHSFTLKRLDHNVMTLAAVPDRARPARAADGDHRAPSAPHPRLLVQHQSRRRHPSRVGGLARPPQRRRPARQPDLRAAGPPRHRRARRGGRVRARPHPGRPRRMPRPHLGPRQPHAEGAARAGPDDLPQRPGHDRRSRPACAAWRSSIPPISTWRNGRAELLRPSPLRGRGDSREAAG